VAKTLNCVDSGVHIVSVVEVGYKRRLLTISVEVETRVQIPIDEALALPQSSWVDTLTSVLVDQGIAVTAISTPIVGAVTTTTPTAVLTVTSADTTAIIGLIIGGVVVVFMLICIYRWFQVSAASTGHQKMIEDRNGIFRGVAIDLKEMPKVTFCPSYD
jgi:hypothetical protein